MNDDHVNDHVTIPSVFLRPLPLRVREYPERSARPRVTLVREVLVALAVEHAPLLAALRRLNSAPLLLAAMDGYTRAADKTVHALGLAHRRELLARDDGPLPIRHDLGDVLALAQLEPATLESWAVATAVLHVTLDRAPGAAELRQALTQIPALGPTLDWLVPALLRWAHVRVYEVLFGPFETDGGPVERVPVEWEALAVTQAAPPMRRPLFERTPLADRAHTLAYQVKAWWAVRVEGQSLRDVGRRWHEHLQPRDHRATRSVEDCGCRTIVRRGVKGVSRLLLRPQ